MKNKMKNTFLIISILVTYWSCTKDTKKDDPKPTDTGKVSLYFDTQTLKEGVYTKLNLDNSGIKDSTTALTNIYTNAAGNKITINSVRYWISNIVLTDSLGKSFSEPNSYHLIEYTPKSIKEDIEITGVPVGSYSKISYSIGVDEIRNHDLTKKTGDLSETIGMSWTWNTGYIFMKMEGRFEISTGKYGYYSYHIGLDANYKTLTFDLPENTKVVKTGSPELHFKNNFLGVFGSIGAETNVLDLKVSNSPMVDAALASKIADNYAQKNGVFLLHHVHQADEE